MGQSFPGGEGLHVYLGPDRTQVPDSLGGFALTSKACSKCNLVKPPEEFHRSATSRDGRTSRCKRCRSADARLYAERRRAAEAAAEERAANLWNQGKMWMVEADRSR